MQIRTILYQHIKILIKHVFLLNFRHELLIGFEDTFIGHISAIKNNANIQCLFLALLYPKKF